MGENDKMNNKRREELRRALSLLENAQSIIENITDQEEDALDNMPENLMDSERYEKIERAADNLNEAQDKLTDVIEYVEDAME